ncbi:MAG: nucleotidyltransferase domain-containing protein [Coriobacteriia bacterium]|nr:nucleotidyltransferase domain-containing protein [Coriobacteriia bacterium]
MSSSAWISPLNASQVAVRAGLTRPAVTSVLDDLAAMGIVRSSSAGRANVHQLVRENIYVERLIVPLFSAEQQLPESLEADLRETFENSAESIVLFGSYARGEQEVGSDVNIVLVARDSPRKESLDRRLHSYAQEFRARYGASLSAVTYDSRDANALWRTASAFFESLKRDAVVISGRGPWEWTDDE